MNQKNNTVIRALMMTATEIMFCFELYSTIFSLPIAIFFSGNLSLDLHLSKLSRKPLGR